MSGNEDERRVRQAKKSTDLQESTRGQPNAKPLIRDLKHAGVVANMRAI